MRRGFVSARHERSRTHHDFEIALCGNTSKTSKPASAPAHSAWPRNWHVSQQNCQHRRYSGIGYGEAPENPRLAQTQSKHAAASVLLAAYQHKFRHRSSRLGTDIPHMHQPRWFCARLRHHNDFRSFAR